MPGRLILQYYRSVGNLRSVWAWILLPRKFDCADCLPAREPVRFDKHELACRLPARLSVPDTIGNEQDDMSVRHLFISEFFRVCHVSTRHVQQYQ